MKRRECEMMALIYDESNKNPLTRCRAIEMNRLDKGVYLGDCSPYRFVVYKDNDNTESVTKAFIDSVVKFTLVEGWLDLEDVARLMSKCNLKGKLQELDEFVYLYDGDEAIVIGHNPKDIWECSGDDAAYYIVDEDSDDVHLMEDVVILALDTENHWVEEQSVDDVVTRVYQEILTDGGLSHEKKQFLEITTSLMHDFPFGKIVDEKEVNLEYVSQDLFNEDREELHYR